MAPASSIACAVRPLVLSQVAALESVGTGDGCGKELDYWFTPAVLHPPPPKEPAKPSAPITLADLPAACRQVLQAP